MSRRLKTVLIGGAALLAVTAVFFLKTGKEMADFEVNYRAGQRLGGGETLYRTSDQHWQFKYSPFSAALYLPLSLLPLPAAKAVWSALIVVSIFLIVSISAKLAAAEKPLKPVWPVLAFLILARYFLRELQLGQINVLVTALLTVMLLVLLKDEDASPSREAAAGCLWGLAAALKPYALIFLPYFLIKKRFRAAAAGTFVVVLTLIVPAVFYGFRGNLAVIREWIATLSASTPHLLTSQDNVSLLGFLSKLLNNNHLAMIVFGLSTALLAVLTLFLISAGRKMPNPALLECALLLLFIPLLSPLGWDYTYLAALLAVLLVLSKLAAFPKIFRTALVVNFVLIALSLYDVLGRTVYAAYMALSIPTLSFLFLAAGLCYLRLKNQA